MNDHAVCPVGDARSAGRLVPPTARFQAVPCAGKATPVLALDESGRGAIAMNRHPCLFTRFTARAIAVAVAVAAVVAVASTRGDEEPSEAGQAARLRPMRAVVDEFSLESVAP